MLTGCRRVRQIGEQVDELCVSHRLGQSFGHQRDVAGSALFDQRGLDGDSLPFGRLKTSRSGVSSTGNPVMTRPSARATTRPEAIADRGTGAQDRTDQFIAAILDADCREVRPDPPPLPLTRWQLPQELVAARKKTARPFSASAFAADQLEDRRQRPAGGHLGQRQNLWLPDREACGRVDVQHVVASFFSSGGKFARAGQLDDLRCRHRGFAPSCGMPLGARPAGNRLAVRISASRVLSLGGPPSPSPPLRRPHLSSAFPGPTQPIAPKLG